MMLQKTQMSEVSTNAEVKTTSFLTSKNREMYRDEKKNSIGTQPNSPSKNSKHQKYNDLLILTPTIINTLAWPAVYLVDSEASAAIKGNFYEISGLRGNRRFVDRSGEVGAQLVYFWADKPTKKINLISIQRFVQTSQNQEKLWLHINIAKFDPDSNSSESSNFYLICHNDSKKNQTSEVWDFCAFEAIDNCRRGVLVLKVFCQESSHHYKVLLLDLFDVKQTGPTKGDSKPAVRVLNSVNVQLSLHFGLQEQHLIKTIKSEFGDIVLMITNYEIYQVEVEDFGEGLKLNIKPYKASRVIMDVNVNSLQGETVKSQQLSSNNIQEQIEDARFMSNGLKLMILTSYGRIVVIEANNFLFGQNMKEIMSAGQAADKYLLQFFVFTKIYPVNGSIAVEFHGKNNLNLMAKQTAQGQESNEKLIKGLVLLKVQGNTLALTKVINLQLDPKELNYLIIRQCEGIDEMLIQFIEKKKLEVVKALKCRVLAMELNLLIQIGENQYNYVKTVDYPPLKQTLTHFQPNQQSKHYHSVAMPQSSRVFYLLRDRELTCYKLFTDLDCEKLSRQMACLFSHSFFQRPLRISVNPLTLHFVIIFREFVKFFNFNYYSIKNFFTLKLKNVIQVKYVSGGEKILLTCSDGLIYLLDAFTFEQTKLMEFYGEINEVQLLDMKHLLIRSIKNVLYLYKREWKEGDSAKEFLKEYQIKLEEGDLYEVDNRQIIVMRKNAFIQVYKHYPKLVPKDITEAEQECFIKLQTIHPHLQKRASCQSLLEDQMPTKLLLSESLGFLLVATNRGNVKQYLWPLPEPTNPNPPEVLNHQVSSHRILSLFLDAKLTNLYVVSENGQIVQLQIAQYINGDLMPYVYVFSQKTRQQDMQKRQFTDRNYFIDGFTPTEIELAQTRVQTIGQLQFFLQKLKDDLEEMSKTMINRGKQDEKDLKEGSKKAEKKFKQNLKGQEEMYQNELEKARDAVEKQQRQFQEEKLKEEEKYQKTLLELYKQSDRLKGILKSQDDKMTEQRNAFIKDFQNRMVLLQEQMSQQEAKIHNDYNQVEERRRLNVLQNKIYDQEDEAEMQLYKVKLHQQQQAQLQQAEETKERLLGQNAKKEKEINNLKHRANYFENLILQTKVQINELTHDQENYDKKKLYLQEELHGKELIIDRIERELMQYLKNTEDMKTIKNNHEFELEEFEKEISPIHDNHQKIQNNVKHMNMEIMSEYGQKVQKVEQITELDKKAGQLKDKKRQTIAKKLQVQNKYNRMSEKLVYLATHPFDGDVKMELKNLLDEKHSDQFTKRDEEREKRKREGEKLIRYKNMIRREIEEQQKREEHVVKNKHQFYRYHKENTALVLEFNELSKTHNKLQAERAVLLQKVKEAKSQLFNTPLRRIPSLSVHKPLQKKLTPFQRYQQEQAEVSRKQQDTSDTKLSRASQSLSFLKGLMKEMSQSESKHQKMQLMRERVRTFVNPELKGRNIRNDQMKKILFGRSRMTSEMLKLK